MSDDDTSKRRGAQTRREYLAYGGAVVTGGLLAGCMGGDDGTTTSEESTGATMDDAATTSSDAATRDGTAAETDTETATAVDGPYTVTMAPMGEVEFEAVPERVYTGLPNTADMAVAAGQADAVDAVYYPEYHGILLNTFYHRLDGVSFEWEGLTDSWGLGKEGFYELDSDVHLTDPAYASTLENLDQQDVEEISEQVGPWFGNYYSDRRRDPPQGWADRYEFYDLWEIFQRVAQVFDAGDRASELAAVHESMRSTIETSLPPEAERPSVALTFAGQNDTFWLYRLNADGFLTAHTRPLGAVDAFDDVSFDGAQKQVDYEAMVAADPDVLLVLFTMTSSYGIADIRSELESDPVMQDVAAVANDRVYAQGGRYQGPLMNLFQLEMTAKQVYPDQFGAWPGYTDGEPYPEIPDDERLFDRERVAAIVDGTF